MVKKLNAIATTIKTLLRNHLKPIQIARKLHISKQRVNYWVKREIKEVQYRRKKFDKKIIDKIISLAENKTTSSMSSRKIAALMNEEFKNENLDVSISKDTVNRYLKAEFGKPRKIRKVFHLTKEQKKERVKFCKKYLGIGLTGEQIFFTDETQIKLGSYINDSIRLTKENQKRLKEGDLEAFKLINREEKKFEPSIMIAGGICSLGLSRLILVEDTVNEFAYAQALLFFKEDLENMMEKSGLNLYFEQDGARPHTSQSNKKLINKLFGKYFIQNPPNSPDISYPIENLWGYLKPKIKKRNPKNVEELKKIAVEEWNSIPIKIIRKCGLGFIKRLEKIVELNGERLEPYHINQIEKELQKEYPDDEDNEVEENPKKKLAMRIIYNDRRLGILKKKEIAKARKKIKEINAKYKKDRKEFKKIKAKDFKLMSIARANSLFEAKKNLKPEKIKKINELKEKIKILKKMDMVEYLRHSKNEFYNKKKEEIEEDDESTIDDAINKILKIKKIEEDDASIKYEIKFE